MLTAKEQTARLAAVRDIYRQKGERGEHFDVPVILPKALKRAALAAWKRGSASKKQEMR